MAPSYLHFPAANNSSKCVVTVSFTQILDIAAMDGKIGALAGSRVH